MKRNKKNKYHKNKNKTQLGSRKYLWLALVLLPILLAGAFAGKKIYDHMHRPPRVVKLTIPPVRTLDELAARIGAVVDADKASILSLMTDSAFVDSLGYSTDTFLAMFVPNTYEVWQHESPRGLMLRLHKECSDFWNKERQALADTLELSRVEVMTLASIVEQETANNAERPMIAGMYLNRLAKNMLLQADPTVKYAVGDPTLRRVLAQHTKTDSPYNTYLYKGLPPGPIGIPSMASINAVLRPAHHDYIYMCAKEDFSGTHNFAKTYQEHLINAHKYTKALDERGIK